MLVFSDAKITVRPSGAIRVEGILIGHRAKIIQFIGELGLSRGTIRLRSGRYVFSRHIDPGTRQRLRNFLVNECPLKRGQM